MEFTFGWLIVFSLLGVYVAFKIAADFTSSSADNHSFVKAWATTLALFIVIGNIGSLGVSWLFTKDSVRTDHGAWLNPCELSEELGLVSDKPYDVEVGARIGGSYGDGYFYSSLFGGSGSSSMRIGSALSIGFDYQGTSTILEIPMQQILFIKDESTTKPTLTATLDCRGSHLVREATQVQNLSPAKLRIDSGMLVFGQEVTESITTVPATSDILSKGLAPIVNQQLEVVEIRLSPDLYYRILG
ncbi:hypothetical protein EOL96_03345 [Candidatus Saccharibacteria bacterium]|nr:hypothetical protein [Candidatus Saccharibacteria bacterium]